MIVFSRMLPTHQISFHVLYNTLFPSCLFYSKKIVIQYEKIKLWNNRNVVGHKLFRIYRIQVFREPEIENPRREEMNERESKGRERTNFISHPLVFICITQG